MDRIKQIIIPQKPSIWGHINLVFIPAWFWVYMLAKPYSLSILQA